MCGRLEVDAEYIAAYWAEVRARNEANRQQATELQQQITALRIRNAHLFRLVA